MDYIYLSMKLFTRMVQRILITVREFGIDGVKNSGLARAEVEPGRPKLAHHFAVNSQDTF